MEVTVHRVKLIRISTNTINDSQWMTIEVVTEKGVLDEITLFGVDNRPIEVRIGRDM